MSDQDWTTSGSWMTMATMKGENAWQSPAELQRAQQDSDPLGLSRFTLIEGNDLSYNNWADVDGALQTLTHIGAGFKKNWNYVPWIAVGVKHGSACGVGISMADLGEAISKMIEGDSLALFGGFMMVNFGINETLVDIISYHLSRERRIFDGVASPSFTDSAQKVLSRKHGKCRMLVNRHLKGEGATLLDAAERFRYVRGGRICQKNYTFVLDLSEDYVRFHGCGDSIDKATLEDCVLAWAIGSTSVSNTITIVRDGMLLSNAVGQQSRVKAARLALDTPHDLKGAVAYSDSFFPFTDGLEILVNAGIKTVFATSGSIRDKEIIAFAAQSGINLIMAPDATARGFYRH